ncbi:hypothetical protein ABK040_003172 [Willaertia magna]
MPVHQPSPTLSPRRHQQNPTNAQHVVHAHHSHHHHLLNSPKLTLLFLTIVQVVMFYDRGAIAAVLPNIKNHWSLSGIQEGLIGSAFIITFAIGSTVFAQLANYIQVNKLMAFGLLIWTISAIFTGLWGSLSKGVDQQWGYYMLVISRSLIGIGEASFLPLSITIIDDLSTEEYKTTFMSFFMLGVPIGVALGYSLSNLLTNFDWTSTFYLESFFGFFFCILFIFIPLSNLRKRSVITVKGENEEGESDDYDENDQLLMNEEEDVNRNLPTSSIKTDHVRISDDEDDKVKLVPTSMINQDPNENTNVNTFEELEQDQEDELLLDNAANGNIEKNPFLTFSIFTSLKYLFCNPIYCFATFGSCGYNFVAGAVQFYAPSYVLYKLKQYNEKNHIGNGDLVYNGNIVTVAFSAVVLVSSILGTILGGFILDRVGGSNGMRGASRGLLFCCICMLIGFPIVFPIFFVSMDIVLLVFLFGLAGCFLFATTSPFQCAVVNSVEHKNLRNFGVSFQIFLYHLLGDFPSPFLFGLFQDTLNSMDYSMLIVWCILLPSAAVFGIGYIVAHYYLKRRSQKVMDAFTTKKVHHHNVMVEEKKDLEENLMSKDL